MARIADVWRNGVMPFAVLGILALLALEMDKETDVVRSDRFFVVDGDSLSRDGERFRLLGIDAPEYRQTCQRNGRSWDCGQAARDLLSQLLPGGRGVCRGRRRDRYDRLLVTCVAGDRDVNAEMVRRGMAVAFGGYRLEETAARVGGAGLWAGNFEMPQDFRRDSGVVAAQRADPLADVAATFRRLLGWQ